MRQCLVFFHGSSDPPFFTGVGQSTPCVVFAKSTIERAIFYDPDLHFAEDSDDLANKWALAFVLGQLVEDRDDAYLKHINTALIYASYSSCWGAW
jgi:hypothetical protein